MISVLFVCLGNICRSPMAEAVFRHYVKEAGLETKIQIDSAGIGEWHIGNPPHIGTQKKLKEEGISFEGLKARQIQVKDLLDFNYVIGMDQQNIEDLQRLANGHDVKIYRFVDWIPNSSYSEVPDPYFTGNFEETYRLVKAGCQSLLQEIQKKLHAEQG